MHEKLGAWCFDVYVIFSYAGRAPNGEPTVSGNQIFEHVCACPQEKREREREGGDRKKSRLVNENAKVVRQK